eukprot:2521453-Rhodomonas_salina.1
MNAVRLEHAPKATVNSAICLRACYAMSGTDLAYGAPLSAYALATRSSVLTQRMVLPVGRRQHTR